MKKQIALIALSLLPLSCLATPSSTFINFAKSNVQAGEDCDPSQSKTCIDDCDYAKQICFYYKYNQSVSQDVTITANNDGKFIIQSPNGKSTAIPASHPKYDATLGFQPQHTTVSFADAGGVDEPFQIGLQAFKPIIKTVQLSDSTQAVPVTSNCPTINMMPRKAGNITYGFTTTKNNNGSITVKCSVLQKPDDGVMVVNDQ